MILSLFYTLQQTLDRDDWHITDIVPTYTNLAVYFTVESTLFHQPHALDGTIEKALKDPISYHGSTYEVPVSYTGEDLSTLSKQLGLDTKELIRLHTNTPYPIAMLGFRPFFPYLLGLDKKLHAPRRKSPRLSVKKGSVAIGGEQTGIYSENSPGGWHIIGYTDFDDFSLLQPGDTIVFKQKDLTC